MSRSKQIFTIPNIMSFFRIALVPVYAVMYLKAKSFSDYLTSAILLAVSALTDMADGVVARKLNMKSDLGIMLDPFADKLTQGMIILCLTLRNTVILPLLIIFVIKETFMFIMGIRIVRKKKMLDGALFAGKLCTAVLFCAMIALVLFPKMPTVYVYLTVSVCSVFMLYSLVSYAVCYKKAEHIKNIGDRL